MAIIGYVFLSAQTEFLVPQALQKKDIDEYVTESLDSTVDIYHVEEAGTMKKPLRERFAGRKIIDCLNEGDSIVVHNSAWILGSPREAVRLLKFLAGKKVALYCLNLGENISLPLERKLVVSEGAAGLVLNLLESLALCESSKHGETIRAAKRMLKKEGRYLGGPVPFGWQVNKDGNLVQKPAEQKIIREIVRLREDRWSYRDVAMKLREKYDIKLSHEGVRKILARNDKKLEEIQNERAQQVVPQAEGLEKHKPASEM